VRGPSPEKRVTLQDIARRTGVTINTVSRALKNKPDISVRTCERIQQVAREMGYVRNYAASSLRSGRTKTLGLILGSMSNPYYAVVADAVHEAASALGYTLLTLCSREDPEQEMLAVETAMSRQVDGILLFPTRGAKDAVQRMRETNMPYVLMSRSLGDDRDDCVMCDEDEGGYLAAKHLIDAGRRKLAYLCGGDIVYSPEHRLQGFHRACDGANIPRVDRRVVIDPPLEDVPGVLQDWYRAGVDGVFVFCDMEAWNAISSLELAGVKIPQDVTVVGYDNIQAKIGFPMPLCTVDPSINEMIDIAMDILRKRIHREELPTQTVKVPARLVCRGSCGK
jgi:LacI family transcriptional regulator